MNLPLPTPDQPRSSERTAAAALRNARTTGAQAFTLVEMMVAIAVLTILLLMITSMMNSASFTVTNSNKHLSADDQARMVFDRLQMDFARMLKRNDVYFQFLKPTGNDQFTFYSETPGFFAGGATAATQSNLSLVSYQFNSSYQLERLGQGCQWTDIIFSPTSTPVPSAANFHVLSSSVFRLEVAFLLRQSDTSLVITGTAPIAGSQDLQNLNAVIVAIGVLDSYSQKLMNPSAYPSLISALPDYSGTQTIALNSASAPDPATIDPILSVWNTAIGKTSFAQTAGISPAVAQQVRVYQRTIYLQ